MEDKLTPEMIDELDVSDAIDLCLKLDISLDELDTVEEFQERIRLYYEKNQIGNAKRKVTVF